MGLQTVDRREEPGKGVGEDLDAVGRDAGESGRFLVPAQGNCLCR